MSITDNTIAQFQAAVKTEILQNSAGKEYTTRPVHFLPDKKLSEPKTLKVATLTGFANYVKNRVADIAAERTCSIHVASHAEVHLISALYGDLSQRDIFIVAAFEDLFGKSFSFGQFYDHESFVIGLQALFVDTRERAEVLRVIGTVKESAVQEHSDNGVTQSVTAKAGIALVNEVPVPNPVCLQPFRTFREIEQPASLFVLRVKSKQGEKPLCALFEADGGKWKLDAIQAIRAYLEAQQLGVPIIA
jgi:hypothetical protein